MKKRMIKQLLNIVFFASLKNKNTPEEYFLSESTDHYDLDYRIKYLDRKK